MKLYGFAGWVLLLMFYGLLGMMQPAADTAHMNGVLLDTVTYGDKRIVYKVSTDTARNQNGDLRRLPDLSNAPIGARYRIYWDTSAAYDSALLITGDTFAMSPLDSTTAATVASNWGYSDPYGVTLAWHDTATGSAPPNPLTGATLAAVYDTMRFSWNTTTDSVRVFSGLDVGGQEDTVYVAGNSSPYDRIAPTIPGDYYACGNTYTTQALANYADNRCGSATVDTVSPGGGGSGTYPNEPAGLVAIAKIDWSNESPASPADTSDFTAIIGEAAIPQPNKLSNMEIVADATSPTGTSNVFRGKFPNGGQGGQSYWRFDLWSQINSNPSTQPHYSEVYTSLWMKIEGTDYEQHPVDTKGYLIGYGITSRHNDASVNLGPCVFSEQSICSSYYLHAKVSENDPDDTSAFTHGPIDFERLITVGAWHQVEIYWKINTIDVPNGILRVWIDGTLKIEVTDIQYRSSLNPDAFYHIQWTPVWGGSAGPVRTQTDYWRFDEFYISAKS